MLNAIHLQLNDDLSEEDISTLNDIYNSHWSHRSENVFVRKLMLLLLNIFSVIFNVGIATVLIKRRKQFRNVTFTTSLAVLNIIIITAYLSAFHSVGNNTVCTPAFNGSLYCATKLQAQFQVTRNVWFLTSYTASRWLILIIAGMQYDSLYKTYTWIGFRLLWPTQMVVLSVLAFSCLVHIPHCIPTYREYVTPYIRASGYCYTWQLYVIVDVIDWLCDWVSALGLVICSTVFLIKKRKVEKTRLLNKSKRPTIGTKALRMNSLTETNNVDPIILLEASIFTGKKFQELVLVAFFTIGTWLPTVMRRTVILFDEYNIDNYLLDEKICDIFDMLLLMNNTIVIFIYYKTCRMSSDKLTSLSRSSMSRSMSTMSPISIARRMSHASSRTMSHMSRSPRSNVSRDVSVNKHKPAEKDLVNKPLDEVKASGEVEPSGQAQHKPQDPDGVSENSSKFVHFKRLPT